MCHGGKRDFLQVVEHHQRNRPRIYEDVGELVGFEHGIDGHNDPANLPCAQSRDHECCLEDPKIARPVGSALDNRPASIDYEHVPGYHRCRVGQQEDDRC